MYIIKTCFNCAFKLHVYFVEIFVVELSFAFVRTVYKDLSLIWF
jgi:hypothetical protein